MVIGCTGSRCISYRVTLSHSVLFSNTIGKAPRNEAADFGLSTYWSHSPPVIIRTRKLMKYNEKKTLKKET